VVTISGPPTVGERETDTERDSGSGFLGEGRGARGLGRVASEVDYYRAGEWVTEVYVCRSSIWEFLEEMDGRFRRKWRRSGEEVAGKVGS
jgi:hypothetical protein